MIDVNVIAFVNIKRDSTRVSFQLRASSVNLKLHLLMLSLGRLRLPMEWLVLTVAALRDRLHLILCAKWLFIMVVVGQLINIYYFV